MDEYFTEYFNQKSVEQPDKEIADLHKSPNGVVTETNTIMRGQTISGVRTLKTIYINDETGVTMENMQISYAKDGMNHEYICSDSGITRLRCGKMTAVAASVLMPFKPVKIGFIGTGRTNLANCIALKQLYGDFTAVIRGSSRNLSKNAGDFMLVCDRCYVDCTKDMSEINTCDLVVVCTSSTEKSEMISTEVLSYPHLIIALDSGYYLDETFRKDRRSICDWKQYFERHYNAEFPFDSKRYNFDEMKNEPVQQKAVMYMIGMGLYDAVAAERFIDAVIMSER